MHKITAVLSLLLLAGAALGQELTLFEPAETPAAEDKTAPAPTGLVNQNGQPVYSLRSSTRIGDNYTVELVDRQGKVVKVNWHAGDHTPIAGTSGFTIEDIQQRTVILALPANDPCVNLPSKGVSCLNGARAKLSLSTAAPLPPTALGPNQGGVPQNPFEAAIQAQQAQAAAQGLPVPNAGAPGTFVNPFTGKVEAADQVSAADQAARDARQRARSERLNRVDQQRIPDNQVPTGMRRVTTPFGDRLVPVRE
jgi:hypothetical protein